MLKICLSRVGKKKQPEYRLIVKQGEKDPWGDAVEILGHYNPRTNPSTVNLKKERIEHWLSVGAQPSRTAANLLIEEGIIKGTKQKAVRLSKKRTAKMDEKKKEAAEKEAEAAAKPAEEAPKEDAPAEEASPSAPADAEATEDKKAEEAPVAEAPAEEKKEEEKPAEEPKPEAEEKKEEPAK